MFNNQFQTEVAPHAGAHPGAAWGPGHHLAGCPGPRGLGLLVKIGMLILPLILLAKFFRHRAWYMAHKGPGQHRFPHAPGSMSPCFRPWAAPPAQESESVQPDTAAANNFV